MQSRSAISLLSHAPKHPGQQRLSNALHTLFPNTNARKSGGVVSPQTNSYLELDFWIPEYKIAFEYQDPHHYVPTWFLQAHSNTSDFKTRDNITKFDRGEVLIPIPCWWDGNTDSLISTIKKYSPSLFSNINSEAEPISPIVPDGYFNMSNSVPNVGELMVASVVHDATFDPSSWWISEKYDGFRACWNCVDSQMYSRSGKKLSIHESFYSLMPKNIFLDGEIWFGRDTFKEAVKISNRQTQFVNWEFSRYVIFDSPPFSSSSSSSSSSLSSSSSSSFSSLSSASLSSSSLLFEDRWDQILANLHAKFTPYVTTAPHIKCTHKEHMQNMTNEILEKSGEGIILHKPKSFYTHGISENLLKIKAYRDEEALVVGRHSSSLLELQLPSGVTFLAENTLFGKTEPKIGEVVTYTYKTYSTKRGEPTFPRIFRTRPDLAWDDVVTNSFYKSAPRKDVNVTTKVALKSAADRYPSGHWTRNESQNLRLLLDKFARDKNLDPLVPETWYSIRFSDFEVKGWMKAFNDSFKKAIVDVYPDIGLQIHKFPLVTRKYWESAENRKYFFERLAKKKGFDPLISSNWYSITYKDIVSEKGGIRLIHYYDFDFRKAIISSFPDIGLEVNNFKARAHFWNDPANRRMFFDNFAKKHGFDPLDPVAWKSVSPTALLKEKGGHGVMGHYQDSKKRALNELYPNLAYGKKLL